MEFIRKKKWCGVCFFIIAVLMVKYMYVTLSEQESNLQSGDSNQVTHNSGYSGKNIPDNVVLDDGTEPNQDNIEEERLLSGIQMSNDQIREIRKVLPAEGNLLVWGLGNDSPYWHNSTRGKVVFLEDDIPLKKAGILWYDKITQQYPYLEAYKVHYTTDTVKSFEKYINSPGKWSELDVSHQLPASLLKTHWHVIIVDAPLGCCNRGPGRYQSIYTSMKLAEEGTHVFVDDFERKVEHEFSLKVLGEPLEVIKRRATKASLANEQAHFIFLSVEQTKVALQGSLDQTK